MPRYPKEEFRVGDLVRVKGTGKRPSDQRYKIESLGPGAFRCHISQWPYNGPPDRKAAWEAFDTSLIVKDNTGPQLLAQLFPFAPGMSLGAALSASGQQRDELLLQQRQQRRRPK